MVDKDIIAVRLSKIKEASRLLDFVDKVSREDFARDPGHFLKAERLLEIIVQSMIDIGTHIIAGKSLKKPEDFHEVFDILVGARVFPGKFAQSLHNLVGLRNLLAHEYLKIDHSRLYKHLVKHKSDFKLFCKYIVKFIING